MPKGQDVLRAFFNKTMLKGTIYPSPNDSAEILTSSARMKMYGIILSGQKSPEDTEQQMKNPFRELIPTQNPDLEGELQKLEFQVRSPYQSISNALNDPPVKDLISRVTAKNPNLKIAFDLIGENQNLFTRETLELLASTPSEMPLTGNTKAEFVKNTVKNLTLVMFMDGFRKGDPRVVTAIPPENRDHFSDFVSKTEQDARNEGFAEQFEIASITQLQLPATRVIDFFQAQAPNR